MTTNLGTIGHDVDRSFTTFQRPDIPLYANEGDCVLVAAALLLDAPYSLLRQEMLRDGLYDPQQGVDHPVAVTIFEQLFGAKVEEFCGQRSRCLKLLGHHSLTIRELVTRNPHWTGAAFLGPNPNVAGRDAGHAIAILDGQPHNLPAGDWDAGLIAVVRKPPTPEVFQSRS
jgi:hypothetical protein